MPIISMDQFIEKNNLQLPKTFDIHAHTNLIHKALQLDNKKQQILENEKNSIHLEEVSREYNEYCYKIYDQAQALSNLWIKKNKWSFKINNDVANSKKILYKIGELAEQAIIPESLEKNNLEKLLQLSLLKQSPKLFLDSTNNQYIKKYTQYLINIKKEANQLNHSDHREYSLKIEKLQNNINKSFSVFNLNTKISKLQNSWIRKIFGWLTGQNQKLNHLIQAKNILSTIQPQLNTIEQHINKYKNEEVALNDIEEFKNELMNNEINTNRMIEIKKSLSRYLSSNNIKIKYAANKLLEEIIASLHHEIKCSQNRSNNHLNSKLNFILFQEQDEHFLFNEARITIKNLINKQVDFYQSPKEAMDFLLFIKSAILDKNEINIDFINEKITQVESWNNIKTLSQKIIHHQESSEEREDFYINAMTLVNINENSTMHNDLKDIFQQIRYQMLLAISRLKQGEINDESILILKDRLALFSIDKSSLSHNKNLNFIKKIRDYIIEKIIMDIQSISTQKELQLYTHYLTKIWPEKICSDHLLVKNNTDKRIVLDKSLIPNELIQSNEPLTAGYQIAVEGTALLPGESRNIRIIPTISQKIWQHILEKRKQFINHKVIKLNKKHQPMLEFLKTNDTNLLSSLWQHLTGETHTALSQENMAKYGDDIFNEYFSEACAMSEYTDIYDSDYNKNENFEPEWIKEEIANTVNEIEIALNKNMNALLYKTERHKIDTLFHQKESITDLGRMILQWKFINQFRNKFGDDYNTKLQLAGIDIIYKMHEVATQYPQFLYSFLSYLSFDQLTKLEDTFLDDSPAPRIGKEGVLVKDIIGDQDKIDLSGRTVLRKSLLFFQVSELLKQELLAFINGEEINEDLFQQHIAFVSSRVIEYEKIATQVSNHEFTNKLKKIIQSELIELGKNTELSDQLLIKENLNILHQENHIIHYVKKMPIEIIDKLSPNLSSALLQLKYFFANRFKNNIENMLKNNNITEEKLERLKKLKNINFYNFIKQVLHDQPVDHLFTPPPNEMKKSMFNFDFNFNLSSNIFSLLNKVNMVKPTNLYEKDYINLRALFKK